jgi:hypothetical protein
VNIVASVKYGFILKERITNKLGTAQGIQIGHRLIEQQYSFREREHGDQGDELALPARKVFSTPVPRVLAMRCGETVYPIEQTKTKGPVSGAFLLLQD